MKIWNTESKKHWSSSREGMMSWTTRWNTILSVFREILPYLPLYELLCTMESNNNLFSTNCFGLLKVKTKIWQDTFLVLVVFLACLPQTLLQRHCIHCSLKVQLRRSHLHQNFAMMIQLLKKIIFLFLHIHSTCRYIMILMKDFIMFSNIKRPPNDEVFQPDKYHS